jgi:hypothetical protein
LLPFVKSVYRLDYAAITKLSLRLFMLGVMLVIPGLGAAYLALTYLYHIDLPPVFLLVGGLLVLPVFGYLPSIYALFRVNRQTAVLAINGLGILVSFGISLALLPRLGMLGAVVAGATAQWTMLVAYAALGRELKGAPRGAVSELS